ncbi:MAG: radical SAM protein [Actinobacteria bacterium]|nr:radical SAM protein [Actinomycetota bacterium]
MTTETRSRSAYRQKNIIEPKLQIVAWEITRSCNLFCAHCRASAVLSQCNDELSTEDCFRLIDEILEVGRPIIILTGGEPLMREDVLQIAQYTVSRGLRVVMGTNGTLVTEKMSAKLKDVPISRLAISLDFPSAELQDEFRGKRGAYQAATAGIVNARKADIEVQINSTITKLNVSYLEELLSLALEIGAVAFHPFLLVPTGRGKDLESVELSPQEYEKTLNWIYDKQIELGDTMFFKPTDAPHYFRVVKQRQKQGQGIVTLSSGKIAFVAGHNPVHSITRGCLAGTGFCFISHQGRVQGCGYLNVEAGNIRRQSFRQIWSGSPLFNQLRDLSNIKGKCGVCEYKRICGGCRARAYEANGDYLEAEPYCVYEPVARRRQG